MSASDLITVTKSITYEIESKTYELSAESIQLEVFKQIKKDAAMVGLVLEFNDADTLLEKYDTLSKLISKQLTHGDVRSFLYRIDVSEKKIRQIDELSVDDLCILVLEREFKKVCIRRHFSPNNDEGF